MTELLVAPRRRRAGCWRASAPGSPTAAPRRRWLALAGLGAGDRGRARARRHRLRRTGRVRAFGGLVVVDALGAYILVLVLVVAAIALAGSPGYLAHERGARARCGRTTPGRYYALLAVVRGRPRRGPARSTTSAWCGSAIEATTIVSALLVGFTRTPAGDRGRLEVPDPGLDRDRLRAARDAARLRLVGRRPRRDERRARLDAAGRDRAAARPGARPPGVHLRARRLRDEGRPRAVPHLAARRAQPGARARSRRCSRAPRSRSRCTRSPASTSSPSGSPRPGVLLDAAGRLRPAEPRGGAAVHRRPGRPQAAARVLLDRAPGPGHARARLRRATSRCSASRSTSPATASPSRPPSSPRAAGRRARQPPDRSPGGQPRALAGATAARSSSPPCCSPACRRRASSWPRSRSCSAACPAGWGLAAAARGR